MKRIVLLLILIVCLQISGCSGSGEMKEDQEVAERFFNAYYAQLAMSSENWDEVEAIMNSYPDYDQWGILSEYKALLSESCLEAMVANRALPNLDMEKLDVGEVSVEDVTLTEISQGTYRDYELMEDVDYAVYEVSYQLKVKKDGSTVSISSSNEIRVISDGGHRVIDYIMGEFAWKSLLV